MNQHNSVNLEMIRKRQQYSTLDQQHQQNNSMSNPSDQLHNSKVSSPALRKSLNKKQDGSPTVRHETVDFVRRSPIAINNSNITGGRLTINTN